MSERHQQRIAFVGVLAVFLDSAQVTVHRDVITGPTVAVFQLVGDGVRWRWSASSVADFERVLIERCALRTINEGLSGEVARLIRNRWRHGR